jgi:hypothetical protein
MKELILVKKMFRILLVLLFVFVLLVPVKIYSRVLTFNVSASRIKISVVPGGMIQFRFSINNLSVAQSNFLVNAMLVNQTQNFPFRLIYQNQVLDKSIVINPSSSKEIIVEVSTTQNMPIGAKGTINIDVKPEGSSDIQKQGIQLNFIVTNQITMLLKQNSSIVHLTDQDPVTLDAVPYIQGGRTFVPLRFIGESFGAKVEWISSEKKIIYTLRGQEITLWINQTRFVSNRIEKEMDSPPEVKPPGRTFVPLRIISEELGAKVEWNEITRQIKIIFTISASTRNSGK